VGGIVLDAVLGKPSHDRTFGPLCLMALRDEHVRCEECSSCEGVSTSGEPVQDPGCARQSGSISYVHAAEQGVCLAGADVHSGAVINSWQGVQGIIPAWTAQLYGSSCSWTWPCQKSLWGTEKLNTQAVKRLCVSALCVHARVRERG
jgi:hypothetical protein